MIKIQNIYNLFFAKYLIMIAIISGFILQSFSQEKSDSLLYKKSIKIDLLPLYNDFFDNRVQIRVGCEYEQEFLKKSSVSCYIDAGLYDKYKFIKYYDFFNQQQGLYSIEQDVLIIGFHIIPSYNYYFYTFKNHPNEKLFSSIVLDFGYYKKELTYYNSQTNDRYSDSYNQNKLGVGLSLGYENQFGKHFSLEIKTSFLTKVFNYVSENGRISIKSLDAQWTSTNCNFWWVSNLKIGYAF
ncbi:MAG: hypothetical protein A2X08_06815 [Bacteroidetes bacterium GWA2_32_17]|nr:MAG: hypothetical protein A2X08_06815 [Bacteroidetes bacterium GWA2_32_17]